MLANSLRIRSVHFAFLFGPPRLVGREEASKVHSRVCDKLGHDDLIFRYSGSSSPEKPEAKGFAIAIERKEGRGAFGATVDLKSVDNPVRLLLSYTWPPSLEHAKETFDMTANAVFASLEGEWQRVMAEVRLRSQCDTREQSGLAFMTGTFFRTRSRWLNALGKPLSSCGVKFEVAATPPVEGDSLVGAKRELLMEVLREEPRGIYLELMSQWPQISAPLGTAGLTLDPRSIREINKNPSDYVKDAYEYLQERVKSLAETEGER